MKAQDLRIGNLIIIYSKESPEISETHLVEPTTLMILLNTISSRGMAFKPIPLSEEWLLKMGFECANGNDITLTVINNLEESHSDLHFWGAIDDDYESGLSGDCVEFFNEEHNTAFGVPIKFVHQLQNLYFALTGEELTIKDI